MRMKAVILASVGVSFCAFLTLACGQKSASPQSGTSATPDKGQIAQPTVFSSIGLYFPCLWFAKLRSRRKSRWLSYL